MASRDQASKKRKTLDDGSPEPSDEWLSLNVSGSLFLVKRSTLISGAAECSPLARMFAPDSPFHLPRDDNDAVLLDRDAEAFQWILGVLRRGGAMTSLPPEDLVRRVRSEADYFGLDWIVTAIDEPPVKEQKYSTEKVCFPGSDQRARYPGEATRLEGGWYVKTLNFSPINKGSSEQNSHDSGFRTVLLERSVRTSSQLTSNENKAEMTLRSKGKKVLFLPAKFGVLEPISGRAVNAKPWNMADRNGIPTISNAEDLDGKVAATGRGGCTFLEKARLAQEAGAIGLLVIQETGLELEEMDVYEDEDASDINFPVLMVASYSVLNNAQLDFGYRGACM